MGLNPFLSLPTLLNKIITQNAYNDRGCKIIIPLLTITKLNQSLERHGQGRRCCLIHQYSEQVRLNQGGLLYSFT